MLLYPAGKPFDFKVYISYNKQTEPGTEEHRKSGIRLPDLIY